MRQYKVCPFCGSHLDYGERCECDGYEQPEIETARRPNFNPLSPLPDYTSDPNEAAVRRAWREYYMR